MQTPLNVVFFGTPDFVVPVAQSLQTHFNLVGIVSTPDAIQGRKKILTPSPVKDFAQANNIPVFTPERYDEATIEQMKSLNPDLFVVAAYGVIIPQAVLDIPTKGSLNIHPSLLPKYRGPSPIQTALLNGDELSGITIIEMDADVDHGPIVSQWEVPLHPADTFASLHVSMFKEAAEKLPEIINGFVSGELRPTPQDHEKALFCDHITRESGYFDSENPPSSEVLDRMIRAYYPWPNAWTRLLVNGRSQMGKFFPEGKMQMEGKNIVTRKEFFNGYPELKEKIEEFFEEK